MSAPSSDRPPVRSHTTQLPVVRGTVSMASLRPMGVGLPGTHPWRALLATLWTNRAALPETWSILAHGVCDHSALGAGGLHDGLPGGFHTDPARNERIRQHVQPPLAPADLLDRPRLQKMAAAELARLGRLSTPFIHRRGERGFAQATWDEALDAIQAAIPKPKGRRMAFLAGPDGLSIEAAYTFAKAARLLASSHIDLCPAPRLDGIEATVTAALGASSAGGALEDVLSTDLILVVGSQLASTDGRARALLLAAKRNGARVVVINPVREATLAQVWSGSDLRSAVFGARLADDFVELRAGGDTAFFAGVAKAVVERDGQNSAFTTKHTDGQDTLVAHLSDLSWDTLVDAAGCPRRDMEWVAELAVRSERAVSLVGPGVVRDPHGADAVGALLDVHLLRGWLGQDGCGLLVLPSSAGALGARAVGLHPARLPGPLPIGPGPAAELSAHWSGHFVPVKAGHTAGAMATAAQEGALDLLVCLGADPTTELPHSEALGRVPVRVHLDSVPRPSMVAEDNDLTVILPIEGFYTQRGGASLLTADRRVRFSPELVEPVGQSRPPWTALHSLVERLDPDVAPALDYTHAAPIRTELALVAPAFAGIESLRSAGEWVQLGGRHGGFDTAIPTESGRARFSAPPPHLPPALQVVARRSPPEAIADRSTVLISPQDARNHGISNGDTIEVTTDFGTYTGPAQVWPMPAGALHLSWPEAGLLFPTTHQDAPLSATLRRLG